MLTRAGLVLGAIAALAVALGIALGQRALNAPLNIPPAGYALMVPPGTSLQSLANRLEAEGILASPLVLTIYGRLSGSAGQIKAGEYDIVAGTTPSELIEQLVAGRVRLHALTIVEGWTTRDLLTAIRGHPAIKHTLASRDENLVDLLELPASSPEGWFFPDTYHFPRDTTDREILARANERMKVMLEQAWARRKSKLPLQSPYEALILASIIEKETAFDRERTRIGGVFVRRLEAGMRLQTDPTVIFGLGDAFKGNLTRRHLEADGPYNTYTRSGLPPSPISLPGEASLLAAVQPDDSDALYFVASGNEDGSHVFSRTLRDHNAAVSQYLQAIRKSNR